MSTPSRPVLLSYAFRPFFLLAGLHAVVLLTLWVAALHGLRWPGAPVAVSPYWHAHEMAVGFGGAVVAGFLLTAVATWTNRPPVGGAPLAALAAAWVAGRLAGIFAGVLPPAVAAAIDLAFPVLLALLAGREILGGRSRRNYGIAALAWALPVLTALHHLGAAGVVTAGDAIAATLTVHVLALLVTVVGGRVIPLFTANWLRMRGEARLPVARPALDRAAIGLVAAAGLADGVAPGRAATGVLCALAGVAGLWRLAGWRGGLTLPNPLVAVLHAAWAGLALGYLLLGATALGLPLTRSAALHLVTVGGIAGMILAMMTRVALGHTGRPLAVPQPVAAAYLLLGCAALVRSAGMALPHLYIVMIDLSAALWAAAFLLFLRHYAPILLAPRVEPVR